jgi:hypothetical protein
MQATTTSTTTNGYQYPSQTDYQTTSTSQLNNTNQQTQLHSSSSLNNINSYANYMMMPNGKFFLFLNLTLNIMNF